MFVPVVLAMMAAIKSALANQPSLHYPKQDTGLVQTFTFIDFPNFYIRWNDEAISSTAVLNTLKAITHSKDEIVPYYLTMKHLPYPPTNVINLCERPFFQFFKPRLYFQVGSAQPDNADYPEKIGKIILHDIILPRLQQQEIIKDFCPNNHDDMIADKAVILIAIAIVALLYKMLCTTKPQDELLIHTQHRVN